MFVACCHCMSAALSAGKKAKIGFMRSECWSAALQGAVQLMLSALGLGVHKFCAELWKQLVACSVTPNEELSFMRSLGPAGCIQANLCHFAAALACG